MKIHILKPITKKKNRFNLARLIGAFTYEHSSKDWLHIHADERGEALYLFRNLQAEEMTLQLCFLKEGKIEFTVINDEPLSNYCEENELHKHTMKFSCLDRAFHVFLADWLQTP